MASRSQQAIDPRGTLQNMLNEGFSERASVAEKVDNALDAGATEITITFDTATGTVIFADNGCGMDEDTSKIAHRINNRKEKSSSRHGRFGRGGAQGTIFMTELETASTCLSKCENTDKPSDSLVETTVNWKRCVDENHYDPHPHKTTVDGLHLWQTYAINPVKRGTVFYVPCSQRRFDALIDQICTKRITENIVYWLGRTYYHFLGNGFKFTIRIDNHEIQVDPIHPLYPSYTEKKHRNSLELQIFKSAETGKLRAYYPEKGVMGFRDFKASARGKRVKDALPTSGWAKIGSIRLQSVYVPKTRLVSLLGDLLKLYESPMMENGNWYQDVREHLYGVFFQRNGKIVSRKDVKIPNSGNKSDYKYASDVCHLITFNADMDEYFDVQVNKSRIDEANFDGEIAKTIEYLMSDFSKGIADADEEVVPPIMPTAPLEPVPIPPIAPAVPAAPAVPRVQTPPPLPAVKPNPPPRNPVPSGGTQPVSAYKRHVSKSEQDVARLFFKLADFVAAYPEEEREEYIRDFDATPGQPFTQQYKTLIEIAEQFGIAE